VTRRDKLIVLGLIALLAFTSAGAVVVDRPAADLVPAFGGSYVEGVAGEYFIKRRIAKPSARARDDESARKLWALSEQLCGVTFR